MGTWGTAISSNDTYADVYGEFFDLYNEGLEVKEISKKIISKNQETINDSEESNNFWFALAKAKWECNELDIELFERVKKIIQTDADIEVWRQLSADEKDIKKRKIVLDKFLLQLQTARPKAKSRKKKIIRQPVYEKGDCLTFKLSNGNYGGAVVMEAIRDSEYGHNLIATTRINQPNIPSKMDFENAEVLILNYASWTNVANINWYLPYRYKKIANLIQTVANIEVQKKYNINNSKFGTVADLDIWIINVIDQQFKFEETKLPPATKLTIKKLTKKNWWKLW